MYMESENLYPQDIPALDALTSCDRSVELSERSFIQTSGSLDVSIHQMFEAQVERTPEAIAIVFEDQQLTYRQLNQRANQLAHHLQALGVGPDVMVGVYLERSPEMIVGLLGILKAGGAYVPIDPVCPSDRLAFILEETEIVTVLTQTELVDNLPAHILGLCLDADWEMIAQNSRANPVCRVTTSHLMYVIYTSGTTGQPKGVLISHAGIYNQLTWRQATFTLTAADRVLQTIALSFDPSVWQIFWPLCFGAQLILPPPGAHRDSAYLVQAIAKYQITILALVPAMLRLLLEEKELEQCHCLRHIFCGGEGLPLDLQQRFFERLNVDNVLHNVYGPTEASIDATFWTCRRDSQHKIAPIGRPIHNTQVYILNADLQEVSLGETGELHIGGVGLARGYLNRPNLTADRFIFNPYKVGERLYKTGDLARYLPDGNLEFLGRLDHQVKIRGFRIELEEIEAILSQHSQVKQSLVVAREDTPGNKRLVAYVVFSEGAKVSGAILRNFLQEKLPKYMVPASFVFLPALPLNANGKIDRHALPMPGLERPDLATAFVAPQNDWEVELTRIWQETLGVYPIGVTDNFIELGGHSLLATQLLQQVEQTFEKRLPIIAFFQAPTIQQQAVLLQTGVTADSAIIPIQPKGTKAPLFGVHVLGKGLSFYRPMAKHLGDDQPLYGLSAQLVDDQETVTRDVKGLAAYYIQNLRSLQPQGPYHLVGCSFGGLVAFEMAQQLYAEGENIALLAMFDSSAPGSTQLLSPLPRLGASLYYLLMYSIPRFIQESAKTAPQTTLTLIGERVRDLTASVFNQGQKVSVKAQTIPEAMTIPQPFSLKLSLENAMNRLSQRILERSPWSFLTPKTQLQDPCIKVYESYDPKPYLGKITLFRAMEPVPGFQRSADLGWGRLALGGIEVCDVPGHHYSIMDSPVLLEQIRISVSSASQSGLMAMSSKPLHPGDWSARECSAQP